MEKNKSNPEFMIRKREAEKIFWNEKNKELIHKQIQLMIDEINNFDNYKTIQLENILQENQKILSLNDIIDIESEYWVCTVNCVNYNPFNI